MDPQVKRLIFGLCIFVGIWNWQIGEVTSSKCHYFSTEKMDWFEALFFCQRLNMCLADMNTRVSFEELENKQTDRAEYWFGLNVYEKLDFTYISTNKPKEYVPPQSEISFQNPCAFLKPLGDDAYAIYTCSCGKSRRFVCAPSVKCNGIKTNSSFIASFPQEIPCQLSDDVTNILGF